MKPLIILTGPTAVGKTELSISLAKAVKKALSDDLNCAEFGATLAPDIGC